MSLQSIKQKGIQQMKEIIVITAAAVLVVASGCASTVTHYDDGGKIVKIEKVTNFSRAMDGTNNKSQMVLVDGTFIGFEASASAGENCTPGVSVKYANGKTALVNAKDNTKFDGCAETVGKFFKNDVAIGIDGVTKK